MIQFSPDPKLAEEQMVAIIFYLTTFGYIDGDFDRREKAFTRDQIKMLVERRFASAPEGLKAETIRRQLTHYLEVFEALDQQVQSFFTEVVAEGESLESFVL